VTAADRTSTALGAAWLQRFERSLEAGDPLGASDTLRKSGVNGWVRKDGYDLALTRAIADAVTVQGEARYTWACGDPIRPG